MKNYLIGGLGCLVVDLVIGIKPVQRFTNEAVNSGTLRGLETCLSYSSSELLSPEAVRATCVAAFQKRLYGREHAQGRAGPRLDEGTVSWGGVLENKTPDHVTTRVRVSVSTYTKEGTEQEFFAETSIWIDPLGKADFRVKLPDSKEEQFEKLDFCEHDDAAPKSCMSWGVIDAMGLTI